MDETQFKDSLHDKLCEVVDLLLAYYNPCRRSPNVCLVTDDILNSEVHCCAHPRRDGKCKHLVDNNCKGECGHPPLNCKIWLCATAIHFNREFTEILRDIEKVAKRYGLVRRPHLGERYVGRGAELAAMLERGIKVEL